MTREDAIEITEGIQADFEKGDTVRFIDTDPEFVEEFGRVGTVIGVLEPDGQLGCDTQLIQVDYHGMYGVHSPDQLEKLL